MLRSITDEVAAELSCNVADLLADVWRGLLLDAGQQLCLDGRLHLQGQARVDLLEGRWQQPPQQHCCHLFDLFVGKTLVSTACHASHHETWFLTSHVRLLAQDCSFLVWSGRKAFLVLVWSQYDYKAVYITAFLWIYFGRDSQSK